MNSGRLQEHPRSHSPLEAEPGLEPNLKDSG